MLLTIDIGNTTVAVGGFQGPELRFVRRLPSDRNMDAAACAARMRTLLAEEGAAPQDVEGAVLSSVVPSLTQVAVQAAEALTRRPVRVLGRDLDPGLPTGDYDVSNLGMDRLVDCVAALARWTPSVPGLPNSLVLLLPSPRDCWVPILCPACAAAPSTGPAPPWRGSPSAWRRSWAPSP